MKYEVTFTDGTQTQTYATVAEAQDALRRNGGGGTFKAVAA